MGSDSIDDSRFVPGQVLLDRYRIVAPIGKGGMGEVYRADDLRLRQPVALKFLPESVAKDAERLERLHQEVRIARQVSHPSVCRVYDIAESDGHAFLTMEYVHGEDLGSVLRRHGKPTTERATQIARQLCAGLGAAHEKGVIHRDLKPANILLDELGHVRITDFGLASSASPHDLRSGGGTPAYMSPEQAEGGAITVRSDIYSLGLVLFELFTGRRALEGETITALTESRRRLSRSHDSILISDVDPAIEVVIKRCLEEDPVNRPASALAVAAALPGGDPLAAALAAGETPSPELIACAGCVGVMRPAYAVASLVGIVAILATAMFIKQSRNLLNYVPLDKSPVVLMDRAREIASKLGWPGKPADESCWFWADGDYAAHILKTDPSPERWKRYETGRPPALVFYYRSSPVDLVPLNVRSEVDLYDPPFITPGMIRMQLDTLGRLHRFACVPPSFSWIPPKPEEPDWSPLFEAAGLNRSDFVATDPTWTPSVPCDVRAAWVGHYPGMTEPGIRVEAGAFQGKLVQFTTVGDWVSPPGSVETKIDRMVRVRLIFFVSLLVLVLLASAFLTWRHLKAGRGDRKGAMRLAGYIAIVYCARHLCQAHHVASFNEIGVLFTGFSIALGAAGLTWLLYSAMEPYARRLWPNSLISWSRLLSGRLRDPLVGRDILFGVLAGAVLQLLDAFISLNEAGSSVPSARDALKSLIGWRHVLGQFFHAQDETGIYMGIVVLLLLLRLIVRSDKLAILIFVGIICAGRTGAFTAPIPFQVVQFLLVAIFTFVIAKLGLLSMLAVAFTMSANMLFPGALDFGQWYTAYVWFGPAITIALTGYAFWISLAGKPLIKDSLAPK